MFSQQNAPLHHFPTIVQEDLAGPVMEVCNLAIGNLGVSATKRGLDKYQSAKVMLLAAAMLAGVAREVLAVEEGEGAQGGDGQLTAWAEANRIARDPRSYIRRIGNTPDIRSNNAQLVARAAVAKARKEMQAHG